MVTFDCKFPDCPEKVTYEPETIPGADIVWGTESIPSREVSVDYGSATTKRTYLECPLGHVFPYDVPV
jgi:hypothetical protein